MVIIYLEGQHFRATIIEDERSRCWFLEQLFNENMIQIGINAQSASLRSLFERFECVCEL